MDSSNTLPLAGIRVIDLTRLLPGPMATLHLADMGADVIKVEDPATGDYARWMGPIKKTQSGFYLAINRNKRSVSLDLKSVVGREAMLELVRSADAVVEGFRPGVMDKLDLNFDTLQQYNPSIVLCSISGYGQDGPWRLKAGHDINYCATNGLLDQTGVRGSEPALGNFQIADIAGGALSATTGLLAALLCVSRGGSGRHIDISMTDCSLAGNVMAQMELDAFGSTRQRGDDFLTGRLPNYGIYATSDGRYLAVGALESVFWRRLCEAIGEPELFALDLEDEQQCELGRQRLTSIFQSRTLSDWQALLDDVDCCVCPVLTLAEAACHPQLQTRGMFLTVDHPTEGVGAQFACPFKMSKAEFGLRLHAPQLGEHTNEVFRELGFDQSRLNALVS